MATKSILKDIEIKDKKLAKSFIMALEHAEKKSGKKVEYNQKVIDIRKDQIDCLFGKQN